MFALKFKNVCIESYAFLEPPICVTSAEIEDRLAPVYDRLKVPFGTLEKLSGIKTRYSFTDQDRPSTAATRVATEAIEKAGIKREDIGVIFNCSVTRDYFEPATGVLVHNNLGMDETVMALDITNACVGFSNGILMLSQMIEAGVVKAGLLVSAEHLLPIMESTFKEILGMGDDLDRETFLKLIPTFTLGSGAVAMVLAHSSIATRGHRVLGSVARSASQFKDYCVGNGDFCYNQGANLDPLMNTDSQKLIAAAGQLGNRAWSDARELLGWSNDTFDHLFCHQIGRQLNERIYGMMGLTNLKEKIIYEKYGNLVSAAMPSNVVCHAQAGTIKSGDKCLLAGFGSGLNAIFTGVQW